MEQNTLTPIAKEDARVVRTKRDLRNALEELLQEKNFDELSVKDITDKALISKNTFYNNFQDKEELLQYLFTKYRKEIMVELSPVLKKMTPIIKPLFLKKAIQIIINFFYSGKAPVLKLIQRDHSKSLFWNITNFIREMVLDIGQEYPHLFNKKVSLETIAS
ncbi:MAG: TetR/AcrR family transcriptional regulator, partial [Candidatus Enterosoma sp.]|nr:TetR/AcrR family transcriptional regulator [Candidatus Enterosoma sp.]